MFDARQYMRAQKNNNPGKGNIERVTAEAVDIKKDATMASAAVDAHNYSDVLQENLKAITNEIRKLQNEGGGESNEIRKMFISLFGTAYYIFLNMLKEDDKQWLGSSLFDECLEIAGVVDDEICCRQSNNG